MTDERREHLTGGGGETGGKADDSRDDEENELEAEQESAEAMDAEVPQPRESDEADESASA